MCLLEPIFIYTNMPVRLHFLPHPRTPVVLSSRCDSSLTGCVIENNPIQILILNNMERSAKTGGNAELIMTRVTLERAI